MSALLGDMLKACGVMVLLGLALLIIIFVAFTFKVRADTNARIEAALFRGYSGRALVLEEREDWDFAHQVCVRVRVESADRRDIMKVAMIQGDSDGGSWEFSREYPTMPACRAMFSRG
jgi:hypothetical protein